MARYVFIIFIVFLFANNNPRFADRHFVDYGRIDASIKENNIENNLLLVQIDAINDSLLTLVNNAVSNLDLYAGPASYHRIISNSQYERLLNVLSSNHLNLINNDYQYPNTRDYWVQTIYGSNYYGSSGEVANTCSCLDANNCVVVGFNDSWYNPLDYYGEAWWNFEPPAYEEITEVRIYVQGAQCDDLPVWSETNVSIRDNNCSWNNNFQATLSIDYTLNGPYIIPLDQLQNIWCDGNLQPVVGSEDNYSVDFVRMEVFYSCETPDQVLDFNASNGDYCDYIELNWSQNDSNYYFLYRDNELLVQLDNATLEYTDYLANQNQTHQYCIESVNDCGESESVCSYGSRKNYPESVNMVMASDGDFSDYISIEWTPIPGEIFYKLYRDGIQLTLIPNNQELVYNDQFVDFQTVYEYCIETINDCGESDWTCDNGFLEIGQLGDVNLDSTLDILDVILLLNFILEFEIPNEDQVWLSDINEDQLLNILDIIALVSIILD